MVGVSSIKYQDTRQKTQDKRWEAVLFGEVPVQQDHKCQELRMINVDSDRRYREER